MGFQWGFPSILREIIGKITGPKKSKKPLATSMLKPLYDIIPYTHIYIYINYILHAHTYTHTYIYTHTFKLMYIYIYYNIMYTTFTSTDIWQYAM